MKMMRGSSSSSGAGINNNNINGPCGACKFLRRKCVKGGCVFAPYFDSSDQGTTEFAAVHRVFGASNASKLLLRIPPNRRLDAVITLCYEAMGRVRDPVYGCVGHIFTLQQQVVNLEAELAYIQARIWASSTLLLLNSSSSSSSSHDDFDFVCNNNNNSSINQTTTSCSFNANNSVDDEDQLPASTRY